MKDLPRTDHPAVENANEISKVTQGDRLAGGTSQDSSSSEDEPQKHAKELARGLL